MKQSGLNEKENNNNTVNEIGLGIIGKKLTPLFRTNKASGYGLIVLVIFLFAAMILFTKPIIISAAKNYRDINLYYAKVVSQRVGIATASPIREHINSVIYGRIQNKLISHTKSFLSEADTYDCQGQQVPTKRAGGKLRNVFSLCDITGIFDDLLGDTNQSIDFAGYLYPDHKTPLQDKKLDMARQSILSQLDNKFDYTLRTIFVAQ